MKPSHLMKNKKYPSVGFCVMCLESNPPDNLTDEHIIPDALGGKLIFKKAVCTPCARAGNQLFEQPTLRNNLLIHRLLIRLRNKKPSLGFPPAVRGRFPLGEIPDELEKLATLEAFPKILPFAYLEPPGLLRGVDTGDGLNGAMTLDYVDISRYYPKSLNFGELGISVRHEAVAGTFERSLAKIAYCFAVAEKGIDAFDGSSIRQLILGERNDFGNFVGEPIVKEICTAEDLHRLSFRIRNQYFLTVIVHLFASYGVRPYEVVVGSLRGR